MMKSLHENQLENSKELSLMNPVSHHMSWILLVSRLKTKTVRARLRPRPRYWLLLRTRPRQ